MFGNLPSLNTHAKTLAPLGGSSSAKSLPSLDSSVASSSHNKTPANLVPPQPVAAASTSTAGGGDPLGYDDDFDEDDDTF